MRPMHFAFVLLFLNNVLAALGLASNDTVSIKLIASRIFLDMDTAGFDVDIDCGQSSNNTCTTRLQTYTITSNFSSTSTTATQSPFDAYTKETLHQASKQNEQRLQSTTFDPSFHAQTKENPTKVKAIVEKADVSKQEENELEGVYSAIQSLDQ